MMPATEAVACIPAGRVEEKVLLWFLNALENYNVNQHQHVFLCCVALLCFLSMASEVWRDIPEMQQ
jgi:hypothetical protein